MIFGLWPKCKKKASKHNLSIASTFRPKRDMDTLLHMKRRVQPLMARDTLGYQYTGDDDTSRMPGNEVDDDDIVERLGRIFQDMPRYTPCPVPEYFAARPPNKVGSRTYVFEYSLHCSSRAHPNSLM
jgi:hypothetical protein